eukprot:GHRQ01022495.1.p1 GENE.GHRQ01022495.1~~GHRQ01022495.1.p1  ORF type:complete len:329 (+),score=170.33 GHRQ01022495.1:24-989(+)
MQAVPGQQQLQQQQGGGLGGLLDMGQQQQDTLDGLLGQVNQELMREAGARQYAALQFGTLDTIGTPTASAAAAAAAVAGVGFPPSSVGMPGGVQHWGQQGGLAGFGGGAVPGWMAGGLSQLGAAGFGQQQVVPQQVVPQGMQAGGAAADSSQDVVRYSRVITCKTYLKRLNITQPMAEHLLPYHDLHTPPARNSSAGSAAADGEPGDSPRGNNASSGKPSSSYELLFKEEVVVMDSEGSRFRVQYEGVSCNQQKHLRLTSGWRDYIRAHDVEVGECAVRISTGVPWAAAGRLGAAEWLGAAEGMRSSGALVPRFAAASCEE